MKKTLLILLSAPIFLFVFSSCLHANNRDGIYVGASVGGVFDQFTLKTTSGFNGYHLSSEASHNQALANIFIGLGYTAANSFFIGAEAGLDFPSRSITITGRPPVIAPYSYTYTDTLRINDYVSADVLPGYSLTPGILLYGRVGLIYSQLSLKQPATGTVHAFNMSDDKWGGRFGLGANIALDGQLGIGLDYIFTAYQNASFYPYALNTRFTPQAHSHFLGVSILYQI